MRLKSGKKLRVLIHVEVQSQRDKNFPERLFVYYYRAFDRKNIPVITLAILADTNPNWRPERYEQIIAGRGLRFDFHVCKLLDFKTREKELQQSTHWFAKLIRAILATLDTIHDLGRREDWKIDLVKNILSSGLGKKYTDSLLRLIDWFMVLPPKAELRFETKIQRFAKENAMPFVTVFERIGRKAGREEGREEGRTELGRENVLTVLKERFGAVPLKTRRVVSKIDDSKKLSKLLKWAIKTDSLTELPKL